MRPSAAGLWARVHDVGALARPAGRRRRRRPSRSIWMRTGSRRWRRAMRSMRGGMRGREQDGLALRGRRVEDRLDVLGEAHVEHLVGLVEHDDARRRRARSVPRLMWSMRPARRGDDDVDAVAQRAELAADRLAAVDRQRPGRRARGRSGTSPRTPAWRARGSARARARSGLGAGRSPVDAAAAPGRANAAVLPVPVAAWPSRSRPASSGGMASRWIGVGSS